MNCALTQMESELTAEDWAKLDVMSRQVERDIADIIACYDRMLARSERFVAEMERLKRAA